MDKDNKMTNKLGGGTGEMLRDDSDDQQEESESRKYMEYGKLIAKGIEQGLRGEHDEN